MGSKRIDGITATETIERIPTLDLSSAMKINAIKHSKAARPLGRLARKFLFLNTTIKTLSLDFFFVFF